MSQSRLFALFDRLVDLPPAERERILAASCAGEPELHAELARLLAADESTAAAELGELAPTRSELLAVGTCVGGNFVVDGVLGEGGMGIVYRARQQVPPRVVALKCLRPGRHSATALARLWREAELMARLQHPGIAQIHASGTLAPTGSAAAGDAATASPWLAMELVDGVPLHQGLSGRPLREQLALLADVADAVQHAHQLGIVHRDLKPANVLVLRRAERLQAKVLDFGIAHLHEGDLALTRTQDVVGTLGYLAPELLQGSTVPTPSADVYALGVMLYELLADRPPLRLAELPLPAASHRLLHDEPPPLARVARQVPRDLATIVHKALAKEPARRYADAGALAGDLRRFLAHEPIAARPPTAFYRASRFVRRHRGLCTGIALAFLALLGGLLATLLAKRDEAAARRHAEQFAAELRLLVRDLVFEVDDELAEQPAATAARRRLVAVGRRYAERLLAGSTDDPALWLEVGAVVRKLAAITGVPGQPNLGDLAGAEALLHEAVDLLQRARVAGLANASLRPILATTLRDLAFVQHGSGRTATALDTMELLTGLVDEQREHFGAAAGDELDEFAVAERTRLRLLAGDEDAAMQDLAVHRQRLRDRAATGAASAARGLVAIEQKFGEYHASRREPELARQAFEAALAHARAAGSDGLPARQRLTGALQSLGSFLVRQGDLAAAEPHLRQALALLRDVGGAEPGEVQAQRELARLEHALADLHLRRRQLDEAEGFARQFERRVAALQQRAPLHLGIARDAGLADELLARIAAARGDETAMATAMRQAIAKIEQRLAREPAAVAVRSDLLRAYGLLGQLRNEVANAQADDRERARLYDLAADALADKQRLLEQLAAEARLPQALQGDWTAGPATIEQLRQAATRLRQ